MPAFAVQLLQLPHDQPVNLHVPMNHLTFLKLVLMNFPIAQYLITVMRASWPKTTGSNKDHSGSACTRKHADLHLIRPVDILTVSGDRTTSGYDTKTRQLRNKTDQWGPDENLWDTPEEWTGITMFHVVAEACQIQEMKLISRHWPKPNSWNVKFS